MPRPARQRNTCSASALEIRAVLDDCLRIFPEEVLEMVIFVPATSETSTIIKQNCLQQGKRPVPILLQLRAATPGSVDAEKKKRL